MQNITAESYRRKDQSPDRTGPGCGDRPGLRRQTSKDSYLTQKSEPTRRQCLATCFFLDQSLGTETRGTSQRFYQRLRCDCWTPRAILPEDAIRVLPRVSDWLSSLCSRI